MRRFLTTILAIMALMVAFATPAHALPKRWEGSPRFTRAGVTYRVDGHDAVITRTRGRRVTIPAEVRYRGRWYEVRAIWDGALKGARVITIRADLETCESPVLWSRRVRVIVTRRGMYRWLHRTGCNVRLA